jgi:hypothetical protein
MSDLLIVEGFEGLNFFINQLFVVDDILIYVLWSYLESRKMCFIRKMSTSDFWVIEHATKILHLL